MNEVIKTIFERHSTRAFTDAPISKDELILLADAARQAPSARNRQSWHFTVIANPALIVELANAMADALGVDRESYRFYSATALILCGSDRADPLGIENCACAMENIFLAAHSLGIASVWINQLKGICDEPAVRAVLSKAGLPENCVVYGTAALGYAAKEFQKPERATGTVNFAM